MWTGIGESRILTYILSKNRSLLQGHWVNVNAIYGKLGIQEVWGHGERRGSMTFYVTTVNTYLRLQIKNIELQANTHLLLLPSFNLIVMHFLFYILYYLLRSGMTESAPGASLPSWSEVRIFSCVFTFYCVLFWSRFDPNQILPLNILLFECEITRVILRWKYSITFYYYVIR